MTKLEWLQERAKADFVSGLWLSDLLEVERAARQLCGLTVSEEGCQSHLLRRAINNLQAALATLQEPHEDRYGQ